MLDITTTPPKRSLEASLLYVSDLLRSIYAITYETGDNLNGSNRDLAFSAVHLLDIARTEMNQLLAQVESC